MKRECRFCKEEFETTVYNKFSCSIRCANLYRYRNPVNHKAYISYRGQNYRNFLMTLRTKLSQRRDLDLDFLCKLYESQDGRCALSGKELTFICGKGVVPTNISIDRINPLGEYTEDNVRLVCRQANVMKQRLSDDELAEWCKGIYETNDRRKRK